MIFQTDSYVFNDRGQLVTLTLGKSLTVPANSIVFVECDLDFRLPEYIALRFNLQIRYVHRGLLLGTGPLVDPGYWGKLCIPLHNLTDQDYEIPLTEGLIWVEFTKTTSKIGSQKPKGRKPLEKQYWDIRDFIEKAAKPFEEERSSVPIRSSIPPINSATESAAAAKAAAKSSQVITIGAAISIVAAAIALVVGVFTLVDSTGSRIDLVQREVVNVEKASLGAVHRSEAIQVELSSALEQLRQANSRLLH
jgi:hypothetical protein